MTWGLPGVVGAPTPGLTLEAGPHRETDMQPVLELTQERWILEVYRTIIETLQGIAWALLLFFLFSLIAYVFVRVSESKKGGRQ